jgi:hypothetical protein
MSVQYQLRIYNRSGAIQHIIADMLNLAYVREVNSPGMLSFDLVANHQAIADLETDAQVEVWRRDASIELDWYCDFRSFWRGEVRASNSDGTSLYTALCVGQMDLLRRTLVAYPLAAANRSEFTALPAETIAKTLVTYNAVVGTAVTANGRARDITTAGVTVQSDGAQGNTLTIRCAYRNLLETLKDIAELGGGDFDLFKTGGAGWEFRWYNGQLGTNRTSTVRFALNYGNMANPVLRRDYSREQTVAIVGGAGVEAARTISVRTGANYHATYNATEVFIDERAEADTAGLATAGDIELSRAQARADLRFDVLQVPQTAYGKAYTLGDLVTGIYQGFSATKKVYRVSVAMSEDGSEKISVELRDV